MSYTADFGMVLQLVSCKPCLSMWQGNCCSNEAEDVPLKTTISIKKRDCFCSHIRVHPLPVPEEAHPKGLMQEFPRTNAEEVPITLPEGEATVTVHSIYSRIGILLRTALADYEGSINVLMDEVSSDMGDRDTKWTSHSLCLESIANSSSEEEDSAATQTSLMPCPKEGNSKDGKDSEERSNVVPFPRSTPSPDLGLKSREAGLQSPEEQMQMCCKRKKLNHVHDAPDDAEDVTESEAGVPSDPSNSFSGGPEEEPDEDNT
ncbi:uncharacterized protein LOC122231206 isoform X2 [Panthera tigris]|uniref:uncharacterized protein LOC122231206 isoform X2 n=1 Tax=Panthera tigris TaxID=9694 RepID=UPI001C6FB618|nr:uncharacterized protein LOC122231206 isoform X2 [Panthera tigris]